MLSADSLSLWLLASFLAVSLAATPIADNALGEKCHDCVWILRCLAIGGIFNIFDVITRNALKSRGLSDLIFKIDFTKRIINIVVVVTLVIIAGLQSLVSAFVINYILGYYINQYFLSRYLRKN